MYDSKIVFSTDFDNKELEKKLQGLKKDIAKSEDGIANKKIKQLGIKQQLDDAKAAALETETTIKNLKAEISSINQTTGGAVGSSLSPDEYTASIDRKKEATAELREQEKILARQDASTERIDKKYASITDEIASANARLEEQKREAGGVEKKLVSSSKGAGLMGPALDKANKHMNSFTRRVSGLMRRILVFTMIAQALRAIKNWFGKVIKTNSEATSAIARLKGALLTMAQPIVEYVLPAFTMLVNVLARIMTAVAKFTSMLFGKTVDSSAAAAKSLYNETDAIESTGSAADKAKKQLAGFDEINTIGGESGSDNSAASQASAAPDFSGFNDGVLKEKVDAITAYVSGALLFLGVILTFSGANIPLGIGLMVLGAIGLADVVSENWNSMDGPVRDAINSVLIILGTASLVIGAILAFSSPANLPLGIALMALGAASMATAVALNWNTIKEALQGPIAEVVALISGALLFLGAALLSTNLPLAIALMAAGAAGLATVVALNWGKLKEELKGPIGEVVALISGALLFLGVLLLSTNLPLGIALIAAGAVGLATVITLNWDTLKSKIKTVISAILAIVGGALIALGILLCLSGVGLGLGLAVLAAGLALSYAAWTLDDNPVTRFVKKLANSVISIINSIIGKINEMFHISFNGLKILGKQVIPAFDTRLVHIPNVPYLAQGAVIPPNREFMAVLGDQHHGTNVEAPLETIQQAVAITMQPLIDAMKAMARNGGGNIALTVNLDGRVVYENVVQRNNAIVRATGESPLLT